MVATTTTLGFSANPAVFRSGATVTATISEVAATGTVTFYENGEAFATETVSGGAAVALLDNLEVGTKTITATYSGDGTYDTSTSSGTSCEVTWSSGYPWPLSITNPHPDTAAGSEWLKRDGSAQALYMHTTYGRLGYAAFASAQSSGSLAGTMHYQRIAIPASAEADVDDGGILCTFAAYCSIYEAGNDYGTLWLAFADGSGVRITDTSLAGPETAVVPTWRELSAWVPPGTRYIDIGLTHQYQTGGRTDYYPTDLQVWLDNTEQGNVDYLIGPENDTMAPGDFQYVGGTAVASLYPILAYAGLNQVSIYTGSGGTGEIYVDLSPTAERITHLLTGTLDFEASFFGQVRSVNNSGVDPTRFYYEFLDASDAVIGSRVYSHPAPVTGASDETRTGITWHPTGTAPIGTTKIRLGAEAIDYGDTNTTADASWVSGWAVLKGAVSVPTVVTSTTIDADLTTAYTGGDVVFTATVNAPAATGTMDFYVDGVLEDSIAVVAGEAQYTHVFSTTGSHNAYAVYSGDGTYITSTSSTIYFDITWAVEASAIDLEAAYTTDSEVGVGSLVMEAAISIESASDTAALILEAAYIPGVRPPHPSVSFQQMARRVDPDATGYMRRICKCCWWE